MKALRDETITGSLRVGYCQIGLIGLRWPLVTTRLLLMAGLDSQRLGNPLIGLKIAEKVLRHYSKHKRWTAVHGMPD